MSKPSAKGPKAKASKNPLIDSVKKVTSRTGVTPDKVSPTKRTTPVEQMTQVNRGVSAGGGNLHRGDRRDTHPSYTTGKVRRDGGRAGPLGASTRKNGPKTARKGQPA